MQIDGEKIFLKPIKKSDLGACVQWLSDPEVNQFTSGRAYSLEEEVEWFESVQKNPHESVFSIFINQTGELIGNCAIHAFEKRDDEYDGKTFVGLMIGNKEEWGKGYGTDALQTLLGYMQSKLKLTEVYLTVFIQNKSAIRCYEKCGFSILEQRKAPERPHMEEYVMKLSLIDPPKIPKLSQIN